MQKIKWQQLSEVGSPVFGVWRARIPVGWLVTVGDPSRLSGVAFVPDAGGQWDLEVVSEEQKVQTMQQLENDLTAPGTEAAGSSP